MGVSKWAQVTSHTQKTVLPCKLGQQALQLPVAPSKGIISDSASCKFLDSSRCLSEGLRRFRSISSGLHSGQHQARWQQQGWPKAFHHHRHRDVSHTESQSLPAPSPRNPRRRVVATCSHVQNVSAAPSQTRQRVGTVDAPCVMRRTRPHSRPRAPRPLETRDVGKEEGACEQHHHIQQGDPSTAESTAESGTPPGSLTSV